MARYMRSDLGRGHTNLRPPVVVTPAAVVLARPIEVSLAAAQRSRRHQARAAHYALRPPAVVGAGIAWHGPGVYLTAPFSGKKREPYYRLRPPTVVTPAAVEAYYGPQTTFIRIRRTRAKSFLRPPVDTIGLEDQGRVAVTLTYSRRGAPVYVLRPPTDTVGLEDQGRVRVELAPQRRGQPKSRLSPPAVVTPAVSDVFYGPQTWLTYSRRGKPLNGLGRTPLVQQDWLGGVMVSLAPQPRRRTKSFLRPPVFAEVVVEVFYGPSITLTRVRPRRVQFFLRPAIIPPLARPIETTLTRIRPQRTSYQLRPPTDTIGLEDQGRVQTNLTYSRRGTAKYLLSPPVVVFLAVEIYGPEVSLTRIRPRPTTTFLRPPSDVSDEQDKGVLRVHLTYSRRGAPKSLLSPPAVVAPVVSYGPFLWLTYSRRGKPRYFLRPAQVVQQPPAYRQVLPPWLTYSRRGRPVYFLNPPTRVFPFIARPTQTSLAPQRRGAPSYFLKPPTVLKTNVPLRINLTYSRRGRPVYKLRPARVVRLAVEIFGPEVSLARIKPRPTSYFLKPPTDVSDVQDIGVLKTWLTYSRRGRPTYFTFPVVAGRAPFRGLSINLTYSRRGKPVSFRQPERVGVAPFRGIQIHLTRIRPPRVLTALKKPTVVGAGVAFYGPQTWLVRIRPPKVIHALRLTLVAFRRPGGDVCGFDIAGSIVCFLEAPGTQVSGSSSSGHQVSGSSSAGSKVTGTQSAGGSVSGSDRKAT